MKKVIKVTANSGKSANGIEQSYEERVSNALHGDEIHNLFNEREPGMVTALGIYQVTPKLYSIVAGQLDAISNNLMDGVKYRAAELIGDENYLKFGPGGKREMELCIKHFAAQPHSQLHDHKDGTFSLKAA
jgi:hypothetical protein